MKNLFLALTLAIFCFMSCDDDPKDEKKNPFVGTWEYTDRTDVRLVFTATNVTSYYATDSNWNIDWTGIYTFDDTNVTVTLDQELSSTPMLNSYGDKFIFGYEFEDGLLLTYTPARFSLRKVTDKS
jgi:hypothetical protein